MQQALFEPADIHKATVHTDGGCDPNPGPGGWAAVVRLADREIVLSGSAPLATNNQMEIEAAIAALAYLHGRYGCCHVDLYTDSRYLRHGITGWIDNWFAHGWKTKGGQPVKNQDLWRTLYALSHAHEVRWHWIKGHAGDPLNERVDQLASEARARLEQVTGVLCDAPVVPRQAAGATPIEISIGVSCLGSDGPGAWAVVIRSGGERQILQGYREQITSNALYLCAAAAGLEALSGPSTVAVCAASGYLVQGASQWVLDWQSRNWQTRGGSPVKNRAEWEALIRAVQLHQVSWHLVQNGSQSVDLATAKAIAAQGTTHDSRGRPAEGER